MGEHKRKVASAVKRPALQGLGTGREMSTAGLASRTSDQEKKVAGRMAGLDTGTVDPGTGRGTDTSHMVLDTWAVEDRIL